MTHRLIGLSRSERWNLEQAEERSLHNGLRKIYVAAGYDQTKTPIDDQKRRRIMLMNKWRGRCAM